MPLLMCSSYPCDICLKSIWHLYSLFSLCCDLVLISEYAADSFFGAGHACWHTLISKVVYPISYFLNSCSLSYYVGMPSMQCILEFCFGSVMHAFEWGLDVVPSVTKLWPFFAFSGGRTHFWTFHHLELLYGTGIYILISSFTLCHPGILYSNLNLVQVPRHGHRSYPLLLSVLVYCQGEAHLFPTDVSTCLC